ncbi:hypothetical protein AGDE_03531 [Angomonas deanei]|uniref:PITH domain containing protein, putative n=1 Tax=Angomonas deanei TaxID=59799 RepID=S9VT85_9TRYP|nr:hypothetical protein AGDE_09487 [Angomonas deanei]EPY40356.1 hypothetical protein AGDE_03572 [Angomonas deanei]EPY40397.1 hypothetical protein AGDE_03531 [Angomonas deanei]CAD2215927.1 PITH domain containing protein, putative [Angomonas deanei]|eukprot:EPY30351.1 hypothetical protein AGDE_09487 [Angomonas deanei]
MPCNCSSDTGLHDHMGDGFMRDGAFGIGVPLNSSIDLTTIQLWNAKHTPTEARRVFSPDTVENTEPISSDDDPELLVNLSLSNFCRIKGISILGPVDGYAPSQVKIFVNLPEMRGFDSVRRLIPQEEIHLAQLSADDRVVYRLNATKFANVSSLSLFFENSFNNDETQLLRVDIFGESSGRPTTQQVATNVVYEGRANPADHATEEERRLFASGGVV